MEKIHNRYKHFNWYIRFMEQVLCDNNDLFFGQGNTIINTFRWRQSIEGYDYWYNINSQLEKTKDLLSASDAKILSDNAIDFYKPIYKALRRDYPELFI